MKKTIIFLSAFSIYGVILAQGINFETSDWASIKSKAKEAKKLIFIDVYTTWCGPCKWMEKNTFNDEEVGIFYNNNFVSFKVDAEKEKGLDFAKEYNISSFPTLLFVDKEGKQINRKSEALNKDDFLQFGQQALDSEKELAIKSSLYNNGNREREFILKYLAILKERDLPTEELALWYFAMIGQKKWISSENLGLIKQYLHNPYSNVIEFLVKNKESESEMIKGNVLVYQTLFGVYKGNMTTLIKDRKDIEMDQLLSHINLIFYSNEVSYLTFFKKKEIAKRDKDWKRYTEECIEYVNKHLLNSNSALNNWAMTFYKNEAITDENALNEALKWTNIALKNEKNDYYNTAFLDTRARLLYKLGRKEEALKVANNTVKIAKNIGADPTNTLKLIEKIKAN
ncbi:thioredoxin family protein [Flavivirga spongiicola]|uniref:Thioredoxin family protein n=1 Tax=Flavivirga spongiicola TaxID=421621 RepID=A0ABU7XRL8_9FLAO|nr:thioredoxin fold domain-containing protein [Flavivirga sp. MEBiC05379]MDO5978210.1 thioredoxin family protein [Flavivirga sp. MEBiC05379]